MAKKKASRYGFTPEIKEETLRLIREDGYTAKQAAEYAGCSINAIQQWKAAAKSGKKTVAAKETGNGADVVELAVKSVKKAKKSKRRRKGTKKTTVVATPAEQPSISFDEFVRGYWNECEGAGDVLRLPPDIMPQAVQYVNNVLRYAYDQFCGR